MTDVDLFRRLATAAAAHERAGLLKLIGMKFASSSTFIDKPASGQTFRG